MPSKTRGKLNLLSMQSIGHNSVVARSTNQLQWRLCSPARLCAVSRGAEEEGANWGAVHVRRRLRPTAMATMFEKLESKTKKPGTYQVRHAAPPERRAASLNLRREAGRACHQQLGVSESEGRLLRLSNARARVRVLPGARRSAGTHAETPQPAGRHYRHADGEQKPTERRSLRSSRGMTGKAYTALTETKSVQWSSPG